MAENKRPEHYDEPDLLSADQLQEIEEKGEAQVVLGLKTFTIKRQFVEDVRRRSLREAISTMKKPLLILHSPLDQVVGVDNATRIFLAAKHPKSFVSLDRADHFLTDPKDAAFAAEVIGGWLPRYLAQDEPQGDEPIEHVQIMETGVGRFQNAVQAGRHRLFADEPESVGDTSFAAVSSASTCIANGGSGSSAA